MPSMLLPSVLWHCWLGSRKGIWPVKNRVVGWWCGYVSGSRCRFAYGPADTTATHYHCSSKFILVLPSWFYLRLPAHPGSPRQNPRVPLIIHLSLLHGSWSWHGTAQAAETIKDSNYSCHTELCMQPNKMWLLKKVLHYVSFSLKVIQQLARFRLTTEPFLFVAD